MLRKNLFFLLTFLLFGMSFFAQSQSNVAFEKTKGSWNMPIPSYVEIQDSKYRLRERVYDRQDSTWRFIAVTSYNVRAVAKGKLLEDLRLKMERLLFCSWGIISGCIQISPKHVLKKAI
jgi:hypothetical protein